MRIRPRSAARKHRAVLAVITSVTLLIASPASADPIEISGTTRACFGAGCTAFESVVSDAAYGLIFTGVDSFDVSLDPGASPTFTLGTFTRGRVNVSSDWEPLPFTLQLIFAVPASLVGAPPALFNASIYGTTPGGGGSVRIDFDDVWRSFGTGPGTFELGIMADPELTKNSSGIVIGSIGNITALSAAPAPVPEPATLLLFGIGLTGVAAFLRRH